MIRFLTLLLLGLFTSLAFADPKPSKHQVDWTEIARWGDRVVVSGEGPRAVDDMLFSMAMSPPDDDSDMWYITIWGMNSCPGCKSLIAAFEKDDNLTPFVAPPPGGKKPWAHFNTYKIEDPTQKWRFKDFKTESGPFPIITIQPPRNKVFGDPRIIVDRIDARDIGGTAALKKRIITSVEAYCKKLKDSGYVPPAHAVKHYEETHSNLGIENSITSTSTITTAEETYGHGQTDVTPPAHKEPVAGPWGPDPPAPTPFNPQYPQFPPNSQQQTPFANSGGDITDTLFGPKMAGFFLAIIAVLRLLDSIGPLFGIKTGTFKGLVELLEKLQTQTQPVAAVAVTPGSQSVVPAQPITVVNPQPSGISPGYLLLSNGQIVAAPSK